MLSRFSAWVVLAGLAGLCVAASPRPLFRDFMGLNGHTVQFRPTLYRPVALLVRDYHPAEWDLGSESDSVPPFPFARNRVDWSAVYGSWRKAGLRVDACVMFESLAREKWKDLPGDCRLYAERFARAFGPSGTNALVETIEIGNEPGKFSDADYRTVLEHMARGFRAGDSRLRIASCALTTGKSHEYAKSVKCLAGLESLLDILTLHTYPQVEGWPTWRRSFPEDPELKDYLNDVRRLCSWRDEHAPEKEVWVTEFGYDASTRTPNPNTEFKQWVGVTDTQQAQWLVRSWLIFSTLPIHRAYVYFFNDDDTPQVHGSSGLTRKFQPKPAFYAAAHLQRTLAEYRFSKAVVEIPGKAIVYEFVHGNDGGRRIWVAWSPTGSGRQATFQLPAVEGNIEKVELMPMSSASPKELQLVGTEIPLTEAPAYIFVGKK